MNSRRNAVYLLIIFSFLIGLATGRAFFFNVAYMFLLLLLISFVWTWMAVRWISISRKTRARRAQVGRHLEEVFTIYNQAIIPKLWLEVRDHSNLPNHRASQITPALGIRSKHEWQTKTLCLSRGEFRLGPMSISSGDPFGLFQFKRQLAASSRILIYPAIIPLRYVELPVGVLSGGEAQRRRTHYVTTNASGVRDYVSGDSFNRIHWPSTARKNKLIVKEFELDPLVDIWLFADFARKSIVESSSVRRVDGVGPIIPTSTNIPKSTEEYVAVIAASLSQYFVGLERALGFAAYTPNREIHQPERGNRQLTRILETLSVARSLSGYTLGQMLTLETPYFTRGTTLIVVTSSVDKNWITEAHILNRKGIRIVCIFVDPATFDNQVTSDVVRGMLRTARIPTIVVKYGDDLATALTQRPI